MVTKKDLVIVVLATFCLTSTLFMTLPSRSTERDPWGDVSGLTVGEPDGKINMRDINYLVLHFNQDVSNMTRNVNVTNWQPQDKVVWVGDFLYTFTDGSSVGEWIRVGELPTYVGGYEKMTVIFKFPDNCAYIEETPNYVYPTVQWRLDPTDTGGSLEPLTTTLYQIHRGQLLAHEQISSDSYPIRAPYVEIWPQFSTGTVPGQIGNLTISEYIYLSNGPIASSTRKTMHWQEWRNVNNSDVGITGLPLAGFTKLTVFLISNVTWSGRIYWGYDPRGESISLNAGVPLAKTYELEGDGRLDIYLYNPTGTPSYVHAMFSVIA